MAVDLHHKVYRVDERPLPVYREVQAGFFGRVSLRATRLRLAVDAGSYAIVTHHAAQRDSRGCYKDRIASREARADISTRRSHKPALVAPAGEPADPRRGLQLQELGKLNASIPGLDALLVQKYLHVAEVAMKSFYTAKYTPIDSGYMGQIVEWPEVVTEGSTLEECRAMLEDALREMVAAYAGMKKEPPLNKAFFEQILVEV